MARSLIAAALVVSCTSPAWGQFDQQAYENCIRGGGFSGRGGGDDLRRATACIDIELKKQRIRSYGSLPSTYYPYPTNPMTAPQDVFVPYRSAALRAEDVGPIRAAFSNARGPLLASLRDAATAMSQAQDAMTFEVAALSAETVMQGFIYRYSIIRTLPEVGTLLASIEQTVPLLRSARVTWRGEADQAARIDYLGAQQGAPALTRDPYAHPAVVEWNIQRTRENYAQIGRVRRELVPLAIEALAALTKE